MAGRMQQSPDAAVGLEAISEVGIAKDSQPRSAILPALDTEFLLRPEMRSIRFALEYSKADLLLRDSRIRSTIIVFGGSRCVSPEIVEFQRLNSNDPKIARQLTWYEDARTFGRIASMRGSAFASQNEWRDNVIATGGGPGLMEAANRGAHEVGAATIGFNIRLPAEQKANRYVTPGLNFEFHYFAMRKMHLAMRANALVVFPGGFGTLDELFEMLTLQQTKKTAAVPIVLYDRKYWQEMINFEKLVAEDMISTSDLELFEFADTPENIWSCIARRGLTAHLNDR